MPHSIQPLTPSWHRIFSIPKFLDYLNRSIWAGLLSATSSYIPHLPSNFSNISTPNRPWPNSSIIHPQNPPSPLRASTYPNSQHPPVSTLSSTVSILTDLLSIYLNPLTFHPPVSTLSSTVWILTDLSSTHLNPQPCDIDHAKHLIDHLNIHPSQP